MPEYLSPGIYVEEVPSAIKPIAGVSTSTAGFIGVVPTELYQIAKNKEGSGTKVVRFEVPTYANTARLITNWTQFTAAFGDLVGNPETAAAADTQKANSAGHINLAHAVYGFFNNGGSRCFVVRIEDETKLDAGLKSLAAIDEIAVVAAPGLITASARDKIVTACKAAERFAILDGPASVDNTSSLTGAAAEGKTGTTPEAPAVVKTVKLATSAVLDLSPAYANGTEGVGATLTAGDTGVLSIDGTSVGVDQRVLVKNQAEPAQNGIYKVTTVGTASVAYVLTRATDFDEPAEITPGIVVSVKPGAAAAKIHFRMNQDSAIVVGTTAITFVDHTFAANTDKAGATGAPKRTDYAAWYFPWIKVFDPATKLQTPTGDGTLGVPPSGHLAGIYARVDAGRGVHKAPANEAILGALDVTQAISKADQDGLNPEGVNCIRVLNGNIVVWGARTVGGDANADLKYINVRRTLLFLRKSLEQGTQWVVFEPNSPALWQQITRNVTAFLTTVWRSGALFGTTAAEAFYVKCDAENNPPELRDLGQVVIEVGVAIVRPAEFVIFRISQLSASGQ